MVRHAHAAQIGVRHGVVAEEGAGVLDRGRRVSTLVGDDREVVVRTGIGAGRCAACSASATTISNTQSTSQILVR